MKKHFLEMRGDKIRAFEESYHEKPLCEWMSLDDYEKKFGKLEINWNSIEIVDESLK